MHLLKNFFAENNKLTFKNKYINLNKIILILIIFAFVLRVIYLNYFSLPNFPDTLVYLQAAEQIQNQELIQNEKIMPGYPFFLLISKIIFSRYIWIDIIFSSLFVGVMCKIHFAIFKDKFGALLCGIMACIYPFFIFYSASGLTETSYIFFIYLFFYSMFAKNYFIAYIFFIISLYIRPTAELIFPFIVLLFFIINNENKKKIVSQFILLIALYCVAFSPWWLHNYQKYQNFVRMNLGDGLVIYAGNNILNKSGGSDALIDYNIEKFNIIKDPFKKNEALKKEAFEFIRNNPADFILLSTKKFLRFWRIWPYAEQYRSFKYKFISSISFMPILILSLFFLAKNKKYLKKLSPMLLFSLYLTFIHTVTVSSLRYRFPIEPLLILMSSLMISQFIKSKISEKNLRKNQEIYYNNEQK